MFLSTHSHTHTHKRADIIFSKIEYLFLLFIFIYSLAFHHQNSRIDLFGYSVDWKIFYSRHTHTQKTTKKQRYFKYNRRYWSSNKHGLPLGINRCINRRGPFDKAMIWIWERFQRMTKNKTKIKTSRSYLDYSNCSVQQFQELWLFQACMLWICVVSSTDTPKKKTKIWNKCMAERTGLVERP